jgi:hypothetical protein
MDAQPKRKTPSDPQPSRVEQDPRLDDIEEENDPGLLDHEVEDEEDPGFL